MFLFCCSIKDDGPGNGAYNSGYRDDYSSRGDRVRYAASRGNNYGYAEPYNRHPHDNFVDKPPLYDDAVSARGSGRRGYYY